LYNTISIPWGRELFQWLAKSSAFCNAALSAPLRIKGISEEHTASTFRVKKKQAKTEAGNLKRKVKRWSIFNRLHGTEIQKLKRFITSKPTSMVFSTAGHRLLALGGSSPAVREGLCFFKTFPHRVRVESKSSSERE
jgi:hypothetical protein